VGVYLGDGELAHASKRKGVTISRLGDVYWRKAFHTARRVLPDAAARGGG
jgi:probable lipoprotein NlpC